MSDLMYAQDFVTFINSEEYSNLSRNYSIKNLVKEEDNNVTLIDNNTQTEYTLLVETKGNITTVKLNNKVIFKLHKLKVDCFNKYLIACVGLIKQKK